MSSSSQDAARLPSFHDAYLSGIVLLPDKQCSLFITAENGELHRLTLFGVERLRADNFQEGNIILDVTVETGELVDKAGVLFALSMDDETRHAAFFEVTMLRIRRGELVLVQISPSYGCEFSCLCQRWLLDRPTTEYQDLITISGDGVKAGT